MRIEDILVKKGYAANIKNARILIEKTREEAGSQEDYYKILGERFHIIKYNAGKKKRFKPKTVRKFWKLFFQIIIALVTAIFCPLVFIYDGLFGFLFVAIAIILIISLDKKVEQMDRDATIK